MLERGWLREVQALLESGPNENAKPFDFIGYRELRAVLHGKISLEEARGAIQQATRRYAKRQLTWFRKERACTGSQGLVTMLACKLVFSRGSSRKAWKRVAAVERSV